MNDATKAASPTAKWTKRVGIVAFLFFFFKGLMWLVVPSLIAYFVLDR